MRLDIPNKKSALLAGHEKGKYIIKTFDFSQIVQWKFEKEGNIAFEIDSLEHPILRAVFPYVNQAEDWSLRLKTIMGRANEPAQA